MESRFVNEMLLGKVRSKYSCYTHTELSLFPQQFSRLASVSSLLRRESPQFLNSLVQGRWNHITIAPNKFAERTSVTSNTLAKNSF